MRIYKGLFTAEANKEQDLKLIEFLFSFLKSSNRMRFVLVFVLLNLSYSSFSQKPDSTKVVTNFGGAVSITNNGISFIPTFSLGKPAVIFDFSVGGRLTFEPQLRFALEGKPWSFIFWWRYKLLKTGNVLVNLGAHPALSFKTMTIPSNGGSLDVIRASRYLAGELSPNYFLSKNISIGMYYLYSRCLENDAARNTNFLTLNGNISNIKLSNQVFMKFTPQVYYLRMDKQDGLYFTSALTLVNKKYPLSISGVINKIIRTDITASKNFVWNVSLIYSFNKKYVRQ